MKLSRPPAALVALAAVAGCGSETDVKLTISGEAPGAVVLFVRVVDDRSARHTVYSAGDADKPVKLPATVYLRLKSVRVGAVIWLADAGGNIVAQGRTETCAEMAVGGRVEVALAPAPEGWSPATADACRCDPDNPLGPMCPAMDGADAGARGPDASGGTEAPDAGMEAAVPADAAEDAAAADAGADAPAPNAAADARDARDSAPDRSPDLRADMATSAVAPAVPGTLFGFENASPDWTSADTPLKRDTVRTEGEASLAFTVGASGITTLRSRSFDTATLSASGTHMSVDLFVNEPQVGDANTEMWVDCESASVFGVYMGYKALAALKAPAWTPLSFKIPAEVMTAFKGKYSDCQVWFQLEGKGLFRYDRMGFAP